MSFSKKLILALDFSESKEALQWVDRLLPFVKTFKVGKQLFTSSGPQIIRDIQQREGQVFLDLKYHDIPNTVAGACHEASKLGVFMLNVHAMGGLEMMKSARQAVDKNTSKNKLLLIAVTVLTSFSEQNLKDVGIVIPLKELVLQYLKNNTKEPRAQAGQKIEILTGKLNYLTDGVYEKRWMGGGL